MSRFQVMLKLVCPSAGSRTVAQICRETWRSGSVRSVSSGLSIASGGHSLYGSVIVLNSLGSRQPEGATKKLVLPSILDTILSSLTT